MKKRKFEIVCIIVLCLFVFSSISFSQGSSIYSGQVNPALPEETDHNEYAEEGNVTINEVPYPLVTQDMPLVSDAQVNSTRDAIIGLQEAGYGLDEIVVLLKADNKNASEISIACLNPQVNYNGSDIHAALLNAGFSQAEADAAVPVALRSEGQFFTTNSNDPGSVAAEEVLIDPNPLSTDVTTQDVTTQTTTIQDETGPAEVANVGQDTVQTPTVSAQARIKQELSKPKTKFAKLLWNITNKNKQYSSASEEVKIATQMIAEGYTIDQIANGFKGNGYSTSAIAEIFKEAGVGADAAYTALSSIALADAEASVKPKGKFTKIFIAIHGNEQWQAMQENKVVDAQQAALKQVCQEMAAAGYDLEPALGNIAADFKAHGMSAKQTYKALIGNVANTTPTAKFTAQPRQTFGDGEVALAAAMLDSGYSQDQVQNVFKQGFGGNGILFHFKNYSYSDDAVNQILQRAIQPNAI